MIKKEKWQSFLIDPDTWRLMQKICVILFGNISWVYGVVALKRISLQFYEYLTKYHFHDDGTLYSIVNKIDTIAYQFIYYPLLVVIVAIILYEYPRRWEIKEIQLTARCLLSFSRLIGTLGFFVGLLPDLINNGTNESTKIWTYLIIIAVSNLFFFVLEKKMERR